MDHYRLRPGEAIAAVSAILLYAFMFLDWFSFKGIATHQGGLLNLFIPFPVPAKNAWDALGFISVVPGVAVGVTLISATVRLGDAAPRPSVPVSAVIAALGLVSAALILYRIVEPPDYGSSVVTYEASVLPPAFLALGAALGIAIGGIWSFREGAVRGRSSPSRV